MNLTLRQKRHCFLEKTLMKKRKKMSDHGRDSHGRHLRETNQDYNNISVIVKQPSIFTLLHCAANYLCEPSFLPHIVKTAMSCVKEEICLEIFTVLNSLL